MTDKNFKGSCNQDKFADRVLRQNNGYFVDFGAYKPVYANNTYYFEQIGWEGLSFEIQNFRSEWSRSRSTECLFCDVTKIDIPTIFKKHKVPKVIDYMTIDIDEATLKCIENLPLENYSIKVLTVEHDFYKNKNSKIKNSIREVFLSNGYNIVCKDVLLEVGKPFEDWWVNPDLVEKSNYEHLICENKWHKDIL